jgi:hypothetical protein
MSDDDKRKDPEAKSGELIRPGPPLPVAAPTGLQRTLYRLFARLSTFPSFNRRYVESLKTAKEVFEAKNELGEAIGKHQEIRDRLKNFGTVLERSREERSRQLFEEKERRRAAENMFKHEKKMQAKKNRQKEEEVEIERMEQELRKARLIKLLDELTQPPPPSPEPAKKTTSKQKLRERAYTRRDREIEKIEAMKKATPETRADLKKAAEKELEEELEKIDKMP